MTSVEIFSGGGGAAQGLHAAGVRALARSEWQHDACETLDAAQASGHIDPADTLRGDVRAVDWSSYAGRVGLLWASPPCQAWSLAGERAGCDDERNGWPWTWDVVDALRPQWLLAENVTGMVMHAADCGPQCAGCYFRDHVVAQARRRYASVQWALLDAAEYGVPQRRVRLYMVAGPRPVQWPLATHGQPGLFAARVPFTTVRQALHLPPGPHSVLDQPMPTLSGGSQKSHVNGRSILSASASMRARYTQAGLHSITVQQARVVMGWAADYPMHGSATSRFRQVANGCCPPVVEALVRAVLAA